jgi:hypothetical protein
MTTLCALAIAVSLVPALPSQNAAAKAQADADMKELASYTLTVDTLNKVDRAMQRINTEMKKDPRFIESAKLEAELKTLSDKEEPTEADDKRKEAIEARLDALKDNGMNMGDAQSLSSMAAKIQSFPLFANALRAEGLAPREYSKFMLALLQAGLAAGMQKAGLLKTTPEGTNPANIKWVMEHEAELQKMQKTWEAK